MCIHIVPIYNRVVGEMQWHRLLPSIILANSSGDNGWILQKDAAVTLNINTEVVSSKYDEVDAIN